MDTTAAVAQARRALKSRGLRVKATLRLSASPRSYCIKWPHRTRAEIYIGWLARTGSALGLADLTQIVLHEYGHAFIFTKWAAFSARDQKSWVDTFGEFTSHTSTAGATAKFITTFGVFDDTQHVSWYATTSAHEDWAECFAHVLTGGAAHPSKKVQLVQRLITKYGAV